MSSDVVIHNLNMVPPSAPLVGGIIQPTCTLSTGSVVLYGLPAIGSWIVNPGAHIGTGLSTVISGLSSGTHNFVITNLYGCNSAQSANVVINIPPSIIPNTPTIGEITNPSCSISTGSVVLNDLPASGSWTLTSTPGTTITGTGVSKTITGLSPGT